MTGPTSHFYDRAESLRDRAASSHPFVPSGRGLLLIGPSREILAYLLDLPVENSDVFRVVFQFRQQFVANEILHRSEILFAKPGQPARTERDLVRRRAILTRQQRAKIDFRLGLPADQPGAAARQVPKLLVVLRRNVGQRDLIDAQQVGQKLAFSRYQHGVVSLGRRPTPTGTAGQASSGARRVGALSVAR